MMLPFWSKAKALIHAIRSVESVVSIKIILDWQGSPRCTMARLRQISEFVGEPPTPDELRSLEEMIRRWGGEPR